MKPLSDLCFRILSAGCAPGCLVGEHDELVRAALVDANAHGWLMPERLPGGGWRGVVTASGARAVRVHQEWLKVCA